MTRLLDRRTRNVAIGTKYAAIARLGFEPRAATRTHIEKLARIRRHRFFFGRAAVRASKRGLQDHFSLLSGDQLFGVDG